MPIRPYSPVPRQPIKQPSLNSMLYPKGSKQPKQVWGSVMNVYKEPETTPAVTPSPTPTNTPSGTPAVTPSPTQTQTGTPNPTSTPTNTPTGTAAVTPTPTPSGTASVTPSPTQTQSGTPNPTTTPTNTPTGTPAETPTNTPTETETPTPTPTGTPAETPTNTPTGTAAVTPTPTPSGTASVTPTPTPSATPPASGTTQAQAYLSAVVSAGGTGITSTVSAATITMFTSLVSNGLYDGMIYMYPFLGGNAAGHKFNALNPVDTNGAYRLTFNGGWTQSSSGATPNGTNAWADTYFGPSTLASLTISAGTMGFYCGNNTSGLCAIGGGGDGASNNYWAFYPRNGSGNMGALAWESAVGATTTATIANSLGGLHFTRSGTTTTCQYYRRGVFVESVSVNANAKAGNSLYLGALNQAGTANQFSPFSHQFTYAHTGLTASQITTLDGIIQTYQTSLGRNVY